VKRAELVAGALLTAFGLLVLFVVIPVWVPGHAEGDYGLEAEHFPVITAAAGTAFAALLLLRSLLGRTGNDLNGNGGAADAPAPMDARNWTFLLVAGAGMAAAFALFDLGGFWLGAPFTVAAFMLIMGERRPLPIVATAVAAPLAIWLVFWKMLGFTLP
jgi:hypothetical protein